MINENIKACRKAAGMTQEELAVRLHVVRQTVSKWEQGASVPDAEVLVCMGQVLDVPVSRLLGVEETAAPTGEALAAELARVNALLAQKLQRENQLRRAGQKRGLMLLFCFAALICAFSIPDQAAAALAAGVCMLGALAVLWRNLALLTSVTTDDLRLGPMRVMTVFSVLLLVLCTALAVMTGTGVLTLSEGGEKILALAIICGVMIFSGLMGPRLPFNRHVGLRLPWTVQDEDTWNLAHRVLAITAVPLAVLYAAAALLFVDFETVTLIAVLLWIGIPGGISAVYFYKKMHGKW